MKQAAWVRSKGDDRALAVDYADPQQRRAIAQAVIAAAETHSTVGLSLREVEAAKEKLADHARDHSHDGVRERGRDTDREL